jgi:hypothetical protein
LDQPVLPLILPLALLAELWDGEPAAPAWPAERGVLNARQRSRSDTASTADYVLVSLI